MLNVQGLHQNGEEEEQILKTSSRAAACLFLAQSEAFKDSTSSVGLVLSVTE